MNADRSTNEEEDRFRALVEQSADWMWELDEKGIYTYSGPQVESMLGLTPEEVVGRTPFDLMPPEEGDRFRKAFEKHIAEGKPFVMLEKVHLHKDGHQVVLEMNGVPFHDRKGRIRGYRGIDRDITRRKQAEKTPARQKAAFYEEILQNTREGIWVTDAKDRMIFFNRGMEEIAGVAAPDVLGLDVTCDFPEEKTRDFLPFYRKAKASLASTRYEARAVTPAGRATVQCGWLVPRVRDACFDGMICTIEDATVRVETEQALRASEEQYRLAQQLSRVGSWKWDIKTGNVQCSDEFIAMFGFEPNAFDGSLKTVKSRIHPDDLVICQEYVRACLEDGSPHNVEYRVVWPDGATHWLLSVGDVQRDAAGRAVRMLGLVMDVTERKAIEANLKQIRDQLMEVQKIVHLGSFEYIAATKTTVWSEEEYRIYGLDPAGPSPTYDMMLAKCIHPDDAALFHETFRQAMQRRSIYELEHRIVRPDGSVRWVYQRAHPYFDEKGNLLRYVGATLDITERKQVEAEHRRLAAQRRLALDAARLGWWQYDPVSRIAKWDDGYRRIFGVEGYSRLNDEILQQIIHPEDLPSLWTKVEAALNPADPQPFVAHYRINRPDGQLRWIEAHGAATFEGEGDRRRIMEFVGTVADITERKKVELALRKSEQRFRSLFEQSPLICELWDDKGTILKVNPAFEKMYQISAETICGKWNAFESKAIEAEGWLPIIQRAYAGETVIVSEKERDATKEGLKDRGRKRWISSIFYPLKDDDGKVVNLVAIHQDITEHKHQEAEREEIRRKLEQTQRLESLGVLAGGIAHDFNNILMAIMGHTELALDEMSPFSPGRESLSEITVAATRAAELCRQMLAYAGKGQFEMRDISLQELIEELLHMLKTCISKKAILNLDLKQALPGMHGDPSQIRQVLMNLVINASEAIGERSGVISITTGAMECTEDYLAQSDIAATAVPGTYLYIEVSDTGSGMDKDTMTSIFEPFFTTKFTGRGLGLSAVIGIVKAHEGALRVCSEAGKGTTFKVLFPAVNVSKKRSDAQVVRDEWRGSGTILLVDDEESVRMVGSRQLRRLGFEVLTAEDGRQAIESYRKLREEIDIVLLDLTMPHLNGEETFRELRRIDPQVRVILASGYSGDDIASRFAGKCLAGCLQKPYSMAKLRSLLSTLLPEATSSENTELMPVTIFHS